MRLLYADCHLFAVYMNTLHSTSACVINTNNTPLCSILKIKTLQTAFQ